MKKTTYVNFGLVVIFLLLSIPLFAQTYDPFTEREKIEVRGSMLVVGNSIIGQDNLPFNDLTRDNQDVDMRYIDIDSDATTFSSSSAEIQLPPHEDGSPTDCYRVVYAGLYWAASLQSGDRSDINQIKFKLAGSSSYIDITGEIIYDAITSPIIAETGEPGNTPYACYADVTNLFNGLTDIEGNYTVANVTSSEGFNNSTGLSAGWTLLLIYEDPELYTKSFTIFDGFSHIFDGHQETINVTGFRTPPAGNIDLQFAYGALDGDRTKSATKLEINGKEVTTQLRSANKFFGSVIENLGYDGNPNPPSLIYPRNPQSENTLGYDTGLLEIINSEPEFIRNDDTAADFRLQVARGQADPIFAFMSAFGVDIIAPDIDLIKTVEDAAGNDIGGGNVFLGQQLFYEINYQSTGNDNITEFTIKDVLPVNIIFDPNTDIDLTNAGGATLQSYDPVTRTLIFDIPDESVEVNDPVFTIRLAVRVVPDCYDLSTACSNEIRNQAFATYRGVINPTIIEEEGSFAITTCLSDPGTTNFLVDISNCDFQRQEILCGSSVDLIAADGYDSYSWSTSPTGTPVIGTGRTYTATATGSYYVTNTTSATCISIEEQIDVVVYGSSVSNPVIPFADVVSICPNDGKELPKIFLCGANAIREITTGISDATSIVWEQLNEGSCAPIGIDDCANEDTSCTWTQVGTGPDFTANTSGQFRIVLNYPGGCFHIFYFNVYQNLLNPTATSRDILCTTPGEITVGGVPSGYEYSLNQNGPYQPSNVFSVNTPGLYTVYIRQVGVPTNPCIFSVPDVLVRQRDFTVSTIIQQPDCNGGFGTIILQANDALPQYYFSIYEGATLVNSVGPINANDYTFDNLGGGTYTVNVSTDDGCTYSEVIDIIQPPLLDVTAAITQPLTCSDGEITIYPVGGTAPYIYYINSTTDSQNDPVYVVTTPGVYNITVFDANNCSASTSIIVDAILPPEFTINQNNILCADDLNSGSININVTNANGNSLRYSIDNGVTYFSSPIFTGLSAGTYDVVVEYTYGTDVCTTVPRPITITVAAGINGTATLTTPYTCTTNGVITVSGVTGGTAPYTYSIDGVNFQAGTTFTGLTDGTYTVTIMDASGCSSNLAPITIAPLNPPVDLDFSHTALSCPTNTTTVTVVAIGGTIPLEYQIIAPASAVSTYQSTNTFAGLSPGTYTFQVRDANDCTYVESYSIAPLPPVTVNMVLTSDLNCTASPDAVITGTVGGGTSPYNYTVSFNGGAFGTSTSITGTTFTYTTPNNGTYEFEITDALGCTVQSGVTDVNSISLPEITGVTLIQPILCNGDNNAAIDVAINNAVGVPPFVINVNNDTTGTNYGTQTSGLPAGDYTITLTDANSCTDTETITISEPTPINVAHHAVDISCSGGVTSQGEVVIDNVTGGTAPYDYYVTGSNGYASSQLNVTGASPITFTVLNFGLYEINVVDANGCSVLTQDVLVASPPSDLDISINATADCTTGGQAVVSIGSSLVSTGPFFFAIYQGPATVYPAGTWLPEDSPGSQSATFTALTPGLTYTFVVYDDSTGCSYYETASAPVPTNSTLTTTALTSNNITCVGSADGSVSFTINSVYGVATNVDYEVIESLSLASTSVSGSGVVPAGGTLSVSNLGPLSFGTYTVLITETSGPNAGCSVISIPFNITESALDLSLSTSIDNNANCNPNSGQISAIAQNGTAPYLYQITTSATPPPVGDPSWASVSTFNVDANTYYVHVKDAYNCIRTTPAIIIPLDIDPVISATSTNQCTASEGNFTIDVSLITPGIAPYSFSVDGGAFQTRTLPFTLSNLSSGTHTIEVQDANGCGNSVSVDIVPPLNIIPSVTTLPTCNDDDGEITVTDSGGSGTYTYSISPNPASVSLSGNVFSGVPSGTYTVTITDMVTSCTTNVSVVVPAAIPLSLETTASPVTCFGDNDGTIEVNITGYSGAYDYEVFDSSSNSVFGVLSGNTSTNPLIIAGLLADSYTITVTETGSPFCSTTSGTITVATPLSPLTVVASETSNVTCDDNNGTITAVASDGWGTYEYELTGAATVAYSSNGTFTNLSAGSYTVNVRDAGGCIASSNVTLTLPTPIDATIAATPSLLSCFGDNNATITVSGVTGGQGTNYSYTLNMLAPVVSSSGPQTSSVFNSLGMGTYNVTVTDGYNCQFITANVTITEPTQIVADLVLATSQTCNTNASLTLSATGGTGTYDYSDTMSFISILGSFNSSITFPVTPGSYRYYVRDANGCVSVVSNEITIDPLPTLTIDLDINNATINCAGDNTGVIVAEAAGGLGNYIYTLQDGAGNDLTGATQNTPGVFTDLPIGTYQVQVDSGDCLTTSAMVTITEPSLPLQVNFTITDVTCNGSNDGVLEIIATGGTGVIKYAISPQLNQFFEEAIFEDLAPGNYQAMAQDELGCFEIFDFTVSEPTPVMIIIVPNSIMPEVCEGDLNGAFSIDIAGGTLPYSAALDDINGTYTTGGATQTIFDFTGLIGGDHIVYVLDAEGCESEWNITFPESVRLDPSVEVDYCTDIYDASSNSVTVSIDSSVDPSEVDYSLDGINFQTNNVFIDVATGSNQSITVRHSNGCEQQVFFDINQYDPLQIAISDGNINEIISAVSGGSGDYEYAIQRINSVDFEPYQDTGTFIIYESGTYTIQVTDSNGCVASASRHFEFVDVCITNYFVPRDGGWGPGCTSQYRNLTFDIFDRYGRKIATLGVDEKWDGTYNGKELPTGDYWYVVKLNAQKDKRDFVGHFTLYR
ncbi:T9SS type B sorting domain-containing protein [Seonamhaeicola maritimus]|uniref:T9SS type B sorting domain-containing protein n=1 Tax=Seonamhaeicola maritimus TaxID=2591822 RepID=A0A5C7GG30_9FLAO|nr:T9SS type B sorting domain-containing protein [Seonamhaeicola maritimus]TXG35967.1 T9SS type B sorting domain-containing protein [Seonamhaeicola maritimus]